MFSIYLFFLSLFHKNKLLKTKHHVLFIVPLRKFYIFIVL